MAVGGAAMANPDEVGAAAMDYLMFSGYVALGYFWLRMAVVAQTKLDDQAGERNFHQAKLATCDFHFKRLLPRTATHLAAISAGSDCLITISAEQMGL